MRQRWGEWYPSGNDVWPIPSTDRGKDEPWSYFMNCKRCGSNNIVKWGSTSAGTQRYLCHDCGYTFTDTPAPPGMRFSADIMGMTLNLFYEGQSLDSIRRVIQLEHDEFPGHATVYEWMVRFTDKTIQMTRNVMVKKVGNLWAADETVLDVRGSRTKEGAENTAWFWDCIDEDTRFLLASHLSQTRTIAGAKSLFSKALERTGKPPKVIITDKLRAYEDGIEQVFGADTHHLLSEGMRTESHNNIIERFHGTLKDRTKVMRGMKNMDTARLITEGWLVHYNYFRPHQALGLKTPAMAAHAEFPLTSWHGVIRADWADGNR